MKFYQAVLTAMMVATLIGLGYAASIERPPFFNCVLGVGAWTLFWGVIWHSIRQLLEGRDEPREDTFRKGDVL